MVCFSLLVFVARSWANMPGAPPTVNATIAITAVVAAFLFLMMCLR
jgi:hypothetical protein